MMGGGLATEVGVAWMTPGAGGALRKGSTGMRMTGGGVAAGRALVVVTGVGSVIVA